MYRFAVPKNLCNVPASNVNVRMHRCTVTMHWFHSLENQCNVSMYRFHGLENQCNVTMHWFHGLENLCNVTMYRFWCELPPSWLLSA